MRPLLLSACDAPLAKCRAWKGTFKSSVSEKINDAGEPDQALPERRIKMNAINYDANKNKRTM